LAIVWAAKELRCYLFGKRFKVFTDHFGLKCLEVKSTESSRLNRWALAMQEFNYEIIFRKGNRTSAMLFQDYLVLSWVSEVSQRGRCSRHLC
jgi:hypothetical protein